MKQDLECWKEADCLKGWNHQDKKEKWDIKDDTKDIVHDSDVIGHEYMWAVKNEMKGLKEAVNSHHKALKNVLGHLEGEVEHLMTQGGCSKKCVSQMKADGMLDDPSYVAEECKCASNWVEFKEPTEDIEVDQTEELGATLPKKTVADIAGTGTVVKTSGDHLSTYTCACIIIIAIQCIMCFGCVYWCVMKNLKTRRTKVTK